MPLTGYIDLVTGDAGWPDPVRGEAYAVHYTTEIQSSNVPCPPDNAAAWGAAMTMLYQMARQEMVVEQPPEEAEEEEDDQEHSALNLLPSN